MKRRARLILLPVAVLLVAFQVRYSVATLEARSTFLYLPFRLKECSNIIEHVEHPASYSGVRRGDELLAVNGRPYKGLSVYRQELRAARRYLDSAYHLSPEASLKALENWPFRVTLGFGRRPETIDVNFANCTCGSLSEWQVVWYCILPPAICLLAGLAAVAVRPTAVSSWLYLGLAVCLSHVVLSPGEFGNWSQQANALEWRDGFRIPALVYQSFFTHSWPAWLLVFIARRSPVVWWTAAPLLALSAIKAFVVIGLSEDFRSTEPIYPAFKAVSAATPPLAVGVFATLLFLLVLVALRKSLGYRGLVALVFLPIPFLYAAGSEVYGLWWMGSLPQLTLASLYIGLAGSLWLTLRKPVASNSVH